MKDDYEGKFQFLRAKDLHLEKKYQRGENLRLSREIAADYDAPAFGSLVVSRRNGSHYVIDGQRRGCAAVLAGKEYVPCIVWKDLPLKGEANTYHKMNNSRQGTNPVNRWESAVVSEYPYAVEGQKILARYGYAVTFLKNYEGSMSINIRCGGLVKELYEKELLADTLHVLTACWPKHPSIAAANIIRAMGKFLEILKGVESADSSSKILKRFKGVPMSVIDERARGYYQSGMCRSMSSALVSVFVSIYNKGRRIGRLEVTL